MRGRKPKPTALKKLAGNPGKRKLNDAEPDFTEITDVEPPEWLPDLAVEMWQTVMPELLAAKVLTVPDLHNVEAFCTAYSMWRDAEDHVKQFGVVIETERSAIKNPAVTVINEAKKQMREFGALLGLDPSSRQRLVGPKKSEDKGNPFDDF